MIFRSNLNYTNTGVTVELRELVENGVNLWDFEYPSYYKDQAKLDFEKKVIDHYYFRQIGQETTGRFLHYFRARIREIMPYYIQLYESEALMKGIEDPFESYNLTETFTEQRSGSGTVNTQQSNESTTESDSESTGSETSDTTRTDNNVMKRSDTPQGSIDNTYTYITEATNTSNNATENGTKTSEGTANTTTTGSGSATSETTSEDEGSVTHTLTRKGNIGVQPLGKEVQALRESFLNIDMMIIDELKDLFLQVY